MKTRRVRSWYNFIKLLFFIILWQSAFVDVVRHGCDQLRFWPYWGSILGYLILLVFLGKSRKADQTLIRMLAWENKAALNPLLTTTLIYCIFLVLTFLPMFVLTFTGKTQETEWHHWLNFQFISCGVAAVMVRIAIWLTMPV